MCIINVIPIIPFILGETLIEIPLTQGKIALIDDEDFDLVNAYTWFAENRKSGTQYAMTHPSIRGGGKQTTLRMHRLIMRALPGQQIDHRDRNGLNNQKENLRFSTQTENLQNRISNRGSSQYKGVSWENRCKKWRAEIVINRKNIYLGLHIKEEEAAIAYNKAALELFGEFASLNFITPDFEEI